MERFETPPTWKLPSTTLASLQFSQGQRREDKDMRRRSRRLNCGELTVQLRRNSLGKMEIERIRKSRRRETAKEKKQGKKRENIKHLINLSFHTCCISSFYADFR